MFVRKVFYFFLGFAIPFIFYSSYAHAILHQIWLIPGQENPYPPPDTHTIPTDDFPDMEFADYSYGMNNPDGFTPWNCGSACRYTSPDGCYTIQTYYRNEGGVFSKRNITYVEPNCFGEDFDDEDPLLTLDTDGDGIYDIYDLYPDDPVIHQYKTVIRYYNDNNEEVATTVMTDLGDVFSFGDSETSTYSDIVAAGESFHDNTNTVIFGDDPDDAGDGSSPGAGGVYSSGSPSENIFSDGSYTDIDGASNYIDPNISVGSPPISSDDSDTLLGKIATNTYNSNNNDSLAVGYLYGINESLNAIETQGLISSGVGDINITSDYTGPSASDIGSSVASNLEDIIKGTDDTYNASGDTNTEYGIAQTSIVPDADLSSDAPSEFHQKTDIVTKLQSYISNNPISSIISGSSVSLSGSDPVLSFQCFSKQVDLTIAGFDSQLAIFGQILLSITTLAGMLLIFRG